MVVWTGIGEGSGNGVAKYLIMASISLSQVRNEDRYNFQTIYDHEDDEENSDSPYHNFILDCNYCESRMKL